MLGFLVVFLYHRKKGGPSQKDRPKFAFSFKEGALRSHQEILVRGHGSLGVSNNVEQTPRRLSEGKAKEGGFSALVFYPATGPKKQDGGVDVRRIRILKQVDFFWMYPYEPGAWPFEGKPACGGCLGLFLQLFASEPGVLDPKLGSSDLL